MKSPNLHLLLEWVQLLNQVRADISLQAESSSNDSIGFKFGEAFQAAKARDSFEDAQDPPDRPGVVKRDPCKCNSLNLFFSDNLVFVTALSDLDENEEVEQFRISTSKKVRLSGNETPEDGQDLNELIDRDDADQEEEGEGNQVEAFHPNDGNEDDETMPDFGDRFSI